jgi:hypothetical protein
LQKTNVREESGMARTNRVLVPAAKAGLDRFKLEIASELGISNYDNIDKGELTSRQNGYVGGEMVRRMVQDYESKL